MVAGPVLLSTAIPVGKFCAGARTTGWHRPPVQDPPRQPCWHAPQLLASVPLRLVSQPFDATPSQLPKPLVHDETPQTPLLQLAAAFASEHVLQVPPPVPQLPAD